MIYEDVEQESSGVFALGFALLALVFGTVYLDFILLGSFVLSVVSVLVVVCLVWRCVFLCLFCCWTWRFAFVCLVFHAFIKLSFLKKKTIIK